MLKQITAILFAVVYIFLFTLALLMGINWLIPVKALAHEDTNKLDISYHGEVAQDIA